MSLISQLHLKAVLLNSTTDLKKPWENKFDDETHILICCASMDLTFGYNAMEWDNNCDMQLHVKHAAFLLQKMF